MSRYLIVWGKHGWEVVDIEDNCKVVAGRIATWDEAHAAQQAYEDDEIALKA